jgi:DNA polymerase-1
LKDLKKLLINQKEISFFHLLDKNTDNQNMNLAGNLAGLALSWSEKNSAFIKINSSIDDTNYKDANVEAENRKTFNQISIDDREVNDKDISKKGKDDIGKYEDNQGINEDDFIQEFKDIFENEAIKKYGHNVKNFLLYLKDININLRELSFDTMIGAYILNPAKDTYLVAELCSEYLNEDIIPVEDLSGKGKNHILFKDIPCDNIIPAACEYSCAIFKLQKVMEELIKSNQQEILYYDIELPLIEVLADMEYNGFKANKDELVDLSKELDNKIKSLTEEIYNLAGEEFNINSPKQLGVILFEKLGLPVKKKTKTGYSTAAEVLEQLIHDHVIISHILEYRQLMKLKTTYTDGLISMINTKTGKIHSKFNQTVVVTGRISSTEPNMQNIPIKLEMGRKVRKVFESSNENYVLTDADYSQIELRVLAHISEDENLIDAFMSNEDIHASTASKVFGVPQDKVTPLMRARAKAVNFGIIYGIGDFSLAKDLGITRKEARRYIDGYLDKYPGVRQYMHDIVTSGKELGYVTTMFNRRRYLPELASKNFTIRSFGERIALNTPIQGSAADIIKIAMVKVYGRLKENNMKSRLILQVHDELIIETHVDEKEEVINILKECMETAVTLKVPLKVDISTGKNWYEVK